MVYLSEEAIENLKEYKYVSGEYSFMDRLFTPFWNFCVELLPKWLAPNLVTLIGLMLVIGSTMVYLPYDLTMS